MKVFKKNSFGAFLVLLVALFLLTGAASAVIMARGSEVAREDTARYLAELSKQTAYKVNQRIEFNLDLLKIAGKQIAIVEGDWQKSEAILGNVVADSSFVWAGYVDSRGNLSVAGEEVVNIAGYPVIEDALAGREGVSDSLVSIFGSGEGALYATPVLHNGQPGAIVGWVPPGTMKLLMDTDTADGIGFSHVVASSGNYILESTNQNALVKGGGNIFERIAQLSSYDEGELAAMKEKMQRGESGHIIYTVNGSVREMDYVPLNEGGWYVLSVVPTQVFSSSLTDFMALSLGIMVMLTVVSFVAFGLYLLWMTGKKNREISKIAFVDPVTGGHTVARFDQLMAEQTKTEGSRIFIALDIRKFRLFNDTFGEVEGDRLLSYVHQAIEESLCEGEFFARVSADVFNIVLKEHRPEGVRERLHSVSVAVNLFKTNSGTPYFVKLNCGAYAISENEGIVTIRDRANTARKQADVLPDRFCSIAFFDDVEYGRLLREREMENSMERALSEGEFLVYLQPKVSLEANKIIGAEALVRWNSKNRGLIPPDEFISFFERNGFVIKLDRYVFEQVCKRMNQWKAEGREVLPVSVNLSPVHLQHADFLEAFEQIRERYDIEPGMLEFELTEHIAFDNLELLRTIVDDIHAAGFRCSMDDFGSGYSSLNVLKDIPVDVLKIDRQFFLGDETRAGVVVQSVVDLAKKLDMRTVAEGVETIPQVDFLKGIECDAVQGYVFSAPVPMDQFDQLAFGEGGSFSKVIHSTD